MNNQPYLNTIVKLFFEGLLANPQALLYLKNRNVTSEQIKTFNIGFVSSDIILPLIPVSSKDESDPWLSFYRWVGGHKYLKLKGHFIFPLYDVQDQIVGFTSRSLEGKTFSKFFFPRGIVFPTLMGITPTSNPFKLEQPPVKMFLVEGLFDFLSLQQFYPSTVCSMTANVASSQLDLFYALAPKNLIVLFDNDYNGQKGAKDVIRKVKENAPWINVESWSYPEKDLADFLKNSGSSKFEAFFKSRDFY
jgi:DNA primase